MKKYTLFFFVIIIFSSCGYIMSGTWEDDDKNWSRAYSQELPDSIELIHSYYQRSPHFTYECQLYFEVVFNERIKNNYTGVSGMVKLDSNQYDRISFFSNKPTWFIPDSLNNYEIWVSEIEFDNFMFFLNKENNHMFWTEYQF